MKPNRPTPFFPLSPMLPSPFLRVADRWGRVHCAPVISKETSLTVHAMPPPFSPPFTPVAALGSPLCLTGAPRHLIVVPRVHTASACASCPNREASRADAKPRRDGRPPP